MPRKKWYNTDMDAARVKSYAKLNIALAVTGVSGGYHNIDSLVCSVDLCDVIKIRKRKDQKVFLSSRGFGSESIPFEDNVAVKAAESYMKAFGTGGADITVEKNIPVCAGLGGSSADAAGVLRGMNALYGAADGIRLKELADGLGSDTGYMLSGGFARIAGRGDKVFPIDGKLRLDFLLLIPPDGVSTAKCYSLCDGCERSKKSVDTAISALLSGDRQALGKAAFNDLYPAAKTINPQVETAFGELESFSPLGVFMTGSGAGVAALFENPEFCEWAKSRYRGRFYCLHIRSVITKL